MRLQTSSGYLASHSIILLRIQMQKNAVLIATATMGALSPVATTLQLRGDRVISQGNQDRRGANKAPLRIRCSNPASTGVENAAEVRNRESSAKREQQLSSQGSEDTHQSRPTAVKAAATKTESEWDVYCDILPDSCGCQTSLHLTSSWPACETEEEASGLMELGSKKWLRLSFASWDLLD